MTFHFRLFYLALLALVISHAAAQGTTGSSSFISSTGGGSVTASGLSAVGGETVPGPSPTIVDIPVTLPIPPVAPLPTPTPAAAAAPVGPLPNRTIPLTPFTGISLCAPFNILLEPNPPTTPPGTFSLFIEAEQPVIDALNATVMPADVAGEIYLDIATAANFSTAQPIKVTVNMPGDALGAIRHFGPAASIYIAPGFNSSSLSVSTEEGAGDLIAPSITAQMVNMQTFNSANTTLAGSLNSVAAVASGRGIINLRGVGSGGATLVLSDLAMATVDQAPTSSINGVASGFDVVRYTGGSCNIVRPPGFLTLIPVCQEVVPPEALAVAVPSAARWTCGLESLGNFLCLPGTVAESTSGTSFQASSPGTFQAGSVTPGASSAQSAAAGTGPVASTSFSSSSGSGTGTSFTSTTQGGTTTELGAALPPAGKSTGQEQAGEDQGLGVSSLTMVFAPGMEARLTTMQCAVPEDQLMLGVEGL